MSGQIMPTSWVSDLIPILSDPTEYVSGILGNFLSYGYDPETSAVRIGVTGAGVCPNYKIEEPSFSHIVAVNCLKRSLEAQAFSGREIGGDDDVLDFLV